MKGNFTPKTLILVPLLLSFSTIVFSQVKFEKGYFISKDGQRTECLIKNLDPHSNPHSFTYKRTDEDHTNTLNAEDVKEVGILGYARYISTMVRIDRSKDYTLNLDELSSTREPAWSNEALFLKVVVDGQAAVLYSYYELGFARFFYSKGNAAIEQLVYKQFKISESAYNINKDYLNQLAVNLTCDPPRQTSEPEYKESDLKKYFIRYNACKGSPVATTSHTVRTKRFSVSLLAGIEHAHLDAESYTVASITHFDAKTTPIAGAEFEYTMPFNKNKLSFLVDIYFDHYSSTGKDSLGVAQIDYGTIASAFGPRYRFFLNDNLNIFVNAMGVLEFRNSSSYQWQPTKPNYLSGPYSLDIRTYVPTFAFAAGCAYKDLSAELRILTTKEIFPDYPNAGSRFNRMALVLKYKLFKF